MLDNANRDASPGAATIPAGSGAPSTDTGGDTIQLSPMFSPDQLRSLADDAVAKGLMTREQANESLALDGVKPQEAATEDGLSPEAAEIDAFFPPAKPEHYEIPPPLDPKIASDPEYMKFDRASRDWLAAARLPREIGSAIATAADQTARVYPSMTPAQRTAYSQAEFAKLEHMWGDQTNAKINLARQLVDEVAEKHPALTVYLRESGAGHNAMVVAQLVNQAERLAARRRL